MSVQRESASIVHGNGGEIKPPRACSPIVASHSRNPGGKLAVVATEHASIRFPLLLAIIAPLDVVVCIFWLHSVWWVFATYQVAICLVIPAVASRRSGLTWREHAALLGLRRGHGRAGSMERVRSVRGISIVLGLATAVVTAGFLVLTRDRFLDATRIEHTLAGWGVSASTVPVVLGIMAVLNAAAEELFWRGYFPGRVALASTSPSSLLTVFLPAALYASYHAVTIGQLVGNAGGAVLMTGGVLGAGLLWGWLRQRTGSVWPALISHSGAVIAYLAVQLWLSGHPH
jgi:membrane protease YdiL (CAAX protease family)